jgi:hypothetical protein
MQAQIQFLVLTARGLSDLTNERAIQMSGLIKMFAASSSGEETVLYSLQRARKCPPRVFWATPRISGDAEQVC